MLSAVSQVEEPGMALITPPVLWGS